MKQREKCSGRGCESRQVHQKYSKLDAGSKKVESGLIATSMLEIKNAFDGPVMVSTGQRVTEWTAHQQRCKKKKTK